MLHVVLRVDRVLGARGMGGVAEPSRNSLTELKAATDGLERELVRFLPAGLGCGDDGGQVGGVCVVMGLLIKYPGVETCRSVLFFSSFETWKHLAE